MNLEIINPEQKVYSGKVKSVIVPGAKGSFGILRNHAPIISTLEKGKVKIIEDNGAEKIFDIERGIIEVNRNKIILIAESL